MRSVDVLIIGQGLAGSFLSFWLIRRGVDVLVVDSPQILPASATGTGTFNPIAGYRFTPFWNFPDCRDALIEAVTEIERFFNMQFLFPLPIARFFRDEEQKKRWEQRKLETVLAEFIDRFLSPEEVAQWVSAPLGGFLTRQSFLLQTEKFLHSWRQFLFHHDALIESRYTDAQLELDHRSVRWNRQVRARFAVFCPGDSILHSHFWNSLLPFQFAKGESLTFAAESLPENLIFNRGVHWAPLGNHIFRFGATYRWDDATALPTAEGYRQLRSALQNFATVPVTILAHHSGVRITFPDHLPALGPHPQYPQLWLFTGLGTKGVGYAPFLASVLAEALSGKDSIPSEVHLNRFG